MASAPSPIASANPTTNSNSSLRDQVTRASSGSLADSKSAIQPAAGSYFPLPHSSFSPANAPSLYADNIQLHGVAIQNISSPAAPHADIVNSDLALPITARPARFTEVWDVSQRKSSIIDGDSPDHNKMQRSRSATGSSAGGLSKDAAAALCRGNTLKKKPSVRRSASLRRIRSRKSMEARSVRSLCFAATTDEADMQSAFFCPVPTSGSPTDVLANRFQAWRKMLKDLIIYFSEIQSHYEHRTKSHVKLGNVLNNISAPPDFLASGGLGDALQILRNHNKQSIAEANKAGEVEQDVILALASLRSDLHQKIKEIKKLSGDFKNSVEKEMEGTRRAVTSLQEVLGQAELDTALTQGKQDPYLLRLAVDRQLEKQIDEENYLHQAYLNLENSGRELESIVVGEICKSYNAYAGILGRESDASYKAIEELRIGVISLPKDTEWLSFIQRDDQFVDPELPLRSAEFIQYPGRDHYACQEIRAGLLERKSKYLKSYTAGWYVLSPTHLHEFKSADKTQSPIMSLYLPQQKLGSHSAGGSTSSKFIIKGRQTGTMHRGHTWVFRAESYDTMMAWYEDIKALTERSREELSNFVRGHTRNVSRASQRSTSSDGVVDEDDEEPFSAATTVSQAKQETQARRPSPGGRFPSDLEVNAERVLQVPMSPLSVNSEYHDRLGCEVTAATSAQPGSGTDQKIGYGATAQTPMEDVPSHAAIINHEACEDGVNPYTSLRLSQPHAAKAATSPIVGQSLGAEMAQQDDGDAAYRPADDRPEGPAHAHAASNSETIQNGPVSEIAQTSESQYTVSSLHIPGEFPICTPTY